MNRNITSVTIILFILLFVFGWFFSKPIYYNLIDFVLENSSDYQIVNLKMARPFFIGCYASLMFASLPLFSWLILAIQNRFKKDKLHFKKYVSVFLVLFGAFALGIIFRAFMLKLQVKHFVEIEGVITSYNVDSFKFYIWGFIFVLIAALIVFFIRKGNEKMNG